MPRTTKSLKENFKFKKYGIGEADPNAFTTDFDDSEWREISIPHDWGIEGDFSSENDPSFRKITQDGMTRSISHTGRTGGLPTVGEGIYRTWVDIDGVETAFLELDGVMWESRVYVNGRLAGGCHFGYLSYEIDITEHVIPGANLIVIHAIVPPEVSRWYSGGGVYRNVRLVTKPKAHICYNGVYVREIYASSDSALFAVKSVAFFAVTVISKSAESELAYISRT